ncbi:cell envelope integrity EipB family protein [Rhizobiaceae bacterium]|nr:cell envelope integrity EipB family protein [Rhizobiaceae bacterium]
MTKTICITTLALALSGAATAQAASLSDLRPHRAVYDLEMGKSSDRSGITGMTGRIVYEMTGSACEGFAVRFRFLTNVQTARKTFTNDQRTTTFEGGDGESFDFVTQSYLNGQLESDVRGKAARTGSGTDVVLSKPDDEEVSLPTALFPSEHVVKLIEAAQAGETIVTAGVYDGSDQGDEIVDTTAIIGKERSIADGAEGEPEKLIKELAGEKAWPVSVSYFSSTDIGNEGEKLPVYQVSFLMQDDGVSRDLTMQYEDYALRGYLQSLEYLEQATCEPKTSN